MDSLIGLEIFWICDACGTKKLTTTPATNFRSLKYGLTEPKCACKGPLSITELRQVDYKKEGVQE